MYIVSVYAVCDCAYAYNQMHANSFKDKKSVCVCVSQNEGNLRCPLAPRLPHE